MTVVSATVEDHAAKLKKNWPWKENAFYFHPVTDKPIPQEEARRLGKEYALKLGLTYNDYKELLEFIGSRRAGFTNNGMFSSLEQARDHMKDIEDRAAATSANVSQPVPQQEEPRLQSLAPVSYQVIQPQDAQEARQTVIGHSQEDLKGKILETLSGNNTPALAKIGDEITSEGRNVLELLGLPKHVYTVRQLADANIDLNPAIEKIKTFQMEERGDRLSSLISLLEEAKKIGDDRKKQVIQPQNSQEDRRTIVGQSQEDLKEKILEDSSGQNSLKVHIAADNTEYEEATASMPLTPEERKIFRDDILKKITIKERRLFLKQLEKNKKNKDLLSAYRKLMDTKDNREYQFENQLLSDLFNSFLKFSYNLKTIDIENAIKSSKKYFEGIARVIEKRVKIAEGVINRGIDIDEYTANAMMSMFVIRGKQIDEGTRDDLLSCLDVEKLVKAAAKENLFPAVLKTMRKNLPEILKNSQSKTQMETFKKIKKFVHLLEQRNEDRLGI
jgi:hypothetical protein